jgi:hypothetical protein
MVAAHMVTGCCWLRTLVGMDWMMLPLGRAICGMMIGIPPVVRTY